MADCNEGGVKETTATCTSDLVVNLEHINAFWKAVGVGDVAEVQKVLNGGWVEEIDCVVVGEGLKGDVGVDLEGHWGRSALMVASGRGHCDLVRFLLEKGAQVDFQDCYRKSALMLASECGQCEVARLLLDRGAEVGLREYVNGKSALMIASECGHCEVVKLLLDAGAQVDLQDKVGRTAIVLASKHGHWKAGVLLLERMAGVDSATLSAIMSTVMVKWKTLLGEYFCEEYLEPEFYFFEYINELIKSASLIECYQGILWPACKCGNFKICQAFVAKCRWVELTPLWGRALFLACVYGHCEIVALLLEKGFPQDLVHYGEYSALAMAFACNGGHCEVVELLLGKGADVDAAIDGESELVSALNHERTEVVRLHLMRKAQIGLWDPEDARLLLDEVGLRDCVNGKSALMIASECGQFEVVKFLLDAGAQVDLQDNVGRTAIVLASKHDHWKVGVLLLERMAGVDSATLSAIMSAVMVECKSLLKEYLDPEVDFFEYIEELIKSASLTECHQEILWLACKCGNFKICQAFVAKCRWVELTPQWGRALFLASAFGHSEIVALLLEKGFPQDLVHYGEYSALAMACACNGGHCEVVELLLGRGADVDAAIDGESVLVSALNHDHTEVIRFLLERGAQVDLLDPEVPRLLLNRGDEVGLRDCWNGKSALMIASGCGQCEVVKLLLDAGAQVDLQDKVGRTAIVLASEHEHWKAGMLLLERMAGVDSATLSAIMSAVMVECKLLLKQQYLRYLLHIDFFEYIEELIKSASLTECYQEILWLACRCGNFKICQAFVAKCRWVELTPLWGRALLLACAFGRCEIVALLLEKGFPQDLVHYGEYSALAMVGACKRGHCEVVKLLLGRGADVDAAIDGESALLSAVYHEHTALEKVTQVDFQDCYGKSHVMLTAARMLLNRGADKVGLRGCVNGKSALMIASECGQCEVVKLLLDAGAQVDLQDKVGRTAIVLASKHGHGKVGMLLLERMAGVDSATLSAIMSAVVVEYKLLLKENLEPEVDFIEELIKRASPTECYQEILWLACGCGNFKTCQAFVAKCRWVELTPLWGTALFLASAFGHCDIVALLLEKGFPQDLVHYKEYSALAMACACNGGHCEVVELLLGRGADVDAAIDGESVLVSALNHEHTEVVRLLLERGAQVDLWDLGVCLRDCVNGKSALMIASECGQCEVVKLLLDAGAQVDLQDKVGRTAIVLASEHQHWKAGMLLLERMAGVDSATLSAIMSAVMVECKLLLKQQYLRYLLHIDFFEYIEELIKSASLTECYQEILWLACRCGNFKICQAFVAKCRWVELTPLWGRALLLACAFGRCEIVALLLEKGFPQDLVHYGEYSALAMVGACKRGHCEVVKLLLGRGADVDAAIDGESALLSAVYHEHTALEKVTQVDFQDCYGKSHVMLTAARMLLNRGADKVGLRGCVNGKSALMIASECGQCEVVKLLLDAGAQVDLQDKVGRTAIVLASKHGHGKVEMLLLERMAGVDSATLSAIMSAVVVKYKLLLKENLEPEVDFIEYIEELIKRASPIECYQEILWLACGCGNFKTCQAFVAKCHWVELSPLWGTALFLASAFGHCDIIALLLGKGFPQDLVHYGEYSALAMACACNGGHCEVVELLLGRGADVDAAIDGESVLVSALNHDHTEVIRFLLERGAQVDLLDPEVPRLLLNRGDEVGLRDCWNGKSALMIASGCGQCEVVKLLLDAGAQVGLQDKVGRTAIVLASEHGDGKVGMLLLERMAEMDSATLSAIMSALIDKCKLQCFYMLLCKWDRHEFDFLGGDFFEYIKELIERASLVECYQEILWLACLCGNFKICQAFLAKCHWVELTPLWWIALFLASAYGHCEIVALLLEKGFPHNLVHYGEYSAGSIVFACKRGHCEVVKLLLGNGADVDSAIDHDHFFNLLWEFDWLSFMPKDVGLSAMFDDAPSMHKLALVGAASHGHTEIVRLLLDKGAQVGLHSAVTSAIQGGFREVVEIFIERYTEKDLLGSDGCSPLMCAIRYECYEMAKFLLEKDAELLLERGAQIDLQDRDGMSALMFTAKDGLFDMAKMLLEKGAQIDMQDKSGRSAVIIASEYQHWGVGKMLIERGAEVDTTTLSAFMSHFLKGGDTAILSVLMSALMLECQDCFESLDDIPTLTQTRYLKYANLLIEKGALIDTGNTKACETLLWLACVNGDFCIALYVLETCPWVEESQPWCEALHLAHTCGHYEIAALLLEKGFPRGQVHYGGVYSSKSLMGACRGGHCEEVKLLLEKGAHVDAEIAKLVLEKTRSGEGRVEMLLSIFKVGLHLAMTCAMEHGHGNVVEVFLERYAQNDLLDINGFSPLMFASKHGLKDMARLLLDRGAQVNLQDIHGKSALNFSCNEEVVTLFLESGAQVDLQDNAGISALMFASKQGFFGVAKLLVDKGAQVNLQDNAGRSVLVWACHNLAEDFGEVYSHYEIAKLLLESGAKLAIPEGSLVRLYMSACKRGDCGVVELLLDAGVEVDAKVKYGKGSTGLMHASKGGHCELVELLLGRGSKVNQQQEYNESSLIYASEGGHADVVKLLLKAGARVDLQADNGCTAKDLAEWRRHVDVVKVLEDPAEVSSTISL